MKWFKHDSDAHRDAKLKKLKMKYGLEGYGLYWFCLELIAGDVDRNHLTFELEHDAEIIAHDTGLHYELVQEMMTHMVSLGLFENQGGTITCLKLAKRLDQSMTSNPEFRSAINELVYRHDGVMTESRESQKQSCKKIEDRSKKIEKKIEDRKGRFTPPSVNEVQEYCTERGNSVDPKAFIDHYTANGWMRGKTKIKDWRACVRLWESREPKREKIH